jgi:hypothetical protein
MAGILTFQEKTAIAPINTQHHDRLSKKIKHRSPLNPQNHDRHSKKIKQRLPLYQHLKITIAYPKTSNSDHLIKSKIK